MKTLQEILFLFFYKNNLDISKIKIDMIEYEYELFKNKIKHCCDCNKIVDDKYKCNICLKYYYCEDCFENTYFCFYCNKDMCFMCKTKCFKCLKCKYNL